MGGVVDDFLVIFIEVQFACEVKNVGLDLFGCAEGFVCEYSTGACQVIEKSDGTVCWFEDFNSNDHVCAGFFCVVGECKMDLMWYECCGQDVDGNSVIEDYFFQCDESCRGCTDLICHWFEFEFGVGVFM